MLAAPRHIGRVALLPLEGDPAVFAGPHAGPFAHSVRALLDIDARSYALDQHCRFMRKQMETAPYTFSHMVFHTEPPGVRVGPWPGWRGIPGLPAIALSWGGCETQATVHWWGDELDRRRLRAVAWFPAGCTGSIRCSISDLRLQPLSVDLYEDQPVGITPRATRLLPALEGRHPRLLFTEHEIAGLQQRARSTHRAHLDRMRSLLAAPYLPPEVTSESKAPAGPERLRPEDRAMLSALVALVDPTPETTANAVVAYRAFVEETRRPDFEPLGIDTQSGEMLFLLVLIYDWLYALLPERERAETRTWLWQVADRVRRHLTPDRRDFAQAHYLGCALGLLSFACVFREEHPQAGAWLEECRGALDTIMTMLPGDGFHPHGANMWIYEYGFLLRWLEIFRVCAGEDLWDHPHWKNASAFRAATLSPDSLYGVTFGDPQFRVGGDAWCHYLIAARTRSPHAMQTANALVDGPHAGVDFRSVPPRRRVYEFLYFDPSVLPEAMRPDVQHFADGGQITVRTGSEGDGLFTFRAGPPIGATRYAAGERGGYGHADPCNGSFLWYTGGTFMVSGPGPTYRRDSALQNIITINGHGQIGDGTVWLPDFFPPETLSPRPAVVVERDAVSVNVDLAPVYLPYLGVRRYHRALSIDRTRRRVLGVDDVTCSAQSTIEWNLHSHIPFTLPGADGLRTFHASAPDITLSVFLLAPLEGDTSTGLSAFVPAYPNDGTRDHFLRWSITGSRVRFVWCLTLEPDPVPPVVNVEDGTTVVLFHDGTVIRSVGDRLRMMEGG